MTTEDTVASALLRQEEEALADAKASLKLPMDSASLAERFFD